MSGKDETVLDMSVDGRDADYHLEKGSGTDTNDSSSSFL